MQFSKLCACLMPMMMMMIIAFELNSSFPTCVAYVPKVYVMCPSLLECPPHLEVTYKPFNDPLIGTEKST